MRVHPSTPGAEVHGGQAYKRIETIVAGDRVLAWGEQTGELSWRPVTQTFVHQTTLLFELKYQDGTKIETTWNHPFWIEGKGWVEARHLTPADVSATAGSLARNHRLLAMAAAGAHGGTAVPGAAETARVRSGPPSVLSSSREVPRYEGVTVYNIEVEGDHTYFVGERGVLVHNYEVSGSDSTWSAVWNWITGKGFKTDWELAVEKGVRETGRRRMTDPHHPPNFNEFHQDADRSRFTPAMLAAINGRDEFVDGEGNVYVRQPGNVFANVRPDGTVVELEFITEGPYAGTAAKVVKNAKEGAYALTRWTASGKEIVESNRSNGTGTCCGGVPFSSNSWFIVKDEKPDRPGYFKTAPFLPYHYVNRDDMCCTDFPGVEHYGPNSRFKVLSVGSHDSEGTRVQILLVDDAGKTRTDARGRPIVLNFAHSTEISERIARAAQTGAVLGPGTYIGAAREPIGYVWPPTQSGRHLHIRTPYPPASRAEMLRWLRGEF